MKLPRYLFLGATVGGLLLSEQSARAQTAAIQALSKRISVLQDHKTISFKKTLNVLGSVAGVSIVIDPATLKPGQQLDDIENIPVRVPKLTAVLLPSILSHVTKQVGGSYRIRGNQIVVVFDKPGANVLAGGATSPQGQKLEALLNKQLTRKISVKKMSDVSFDRALYSLAYQNGLNVLVDAEGFTLRGTKDVFSATVSLPELKNVSLATALQRLLSQVGGRYQVRDFVLWIEPVAKK